LGNVLINTFLCSGVASFVVESTEDFKEVNLDIIHGEKETGKLKAYYSYSASNSEPKQTMVCESHVSHPAQIRKIFFFLITAIFLLRTVFYMNWLHDSHDSLIITIFSIHFGQCISIFSSFCSPLDVMQLGCRGDRSHHFQKKLGQFFSKKGATKCTTT